MDIFARLAAELDNEGRYHLLNAAANHLRFPNVHTHYFSSLKLALFSDAKEVCLMRASSVCIVIHAKGCKSRSISRRPKQSVVQRTDANRAARLHVCDATCCASAIHA